jgi:hypothetical protein
MLVTQCWMKRGRKSPSKCASILSQQSQRLCTLAMQSEKADLETHVIKIYDQSSQVARELLAGPGDSEFSWGINRNFQTVPHSDNLGVGAHAILSEE